MNVLVDDSIISSNVALLPETLMMTMMMRMMMMRMTCFFTAINLMTGCMKTVWLLVMCEKQRSDGQIVEEGTIHDPSWQKSKALESEWHKNKPFFFHRLTGKTISIVRCCTLTASGEKTVEWFIWNYNNWCCCIFSPLVDILVFLLHLFLRMHNRAVKIRMPLS